MDGSAHRILIVEDDEVIAKLLAAVLGEAGYASHVAASPHEAQGTYDLIIADYLAPSFAPDEPWPHLDTLRRLSAGAPIVGCTAHQDAAFGPPSALGVSEIVVKPFDLDQVLATVRRLLGGDDIAALAN